MKPVLLLLILLSLAVPAGADVIHLKNGTALHGTVSKSAQGWSVTGADGKVTTVAADEVRSISLSGREASGGHAEALLASLRRAVVNISDLKEIVGKYQNFIKQNASTPAADEARKDLATWQERLDRGMVKVADRWVTPQERDRLIEQSVSRIDQIRELIKSDRIKEAEPLLIQALQENPNSPALQYLKGLALYRQTQIVPARQAFEAANHLLAEHGPTLNNLAVIAIRQNRWLVAMGLLDQAMTAAPEDARILNNVAEALNAAPAEAAQTPIGRKVAQHFANFDAQLAAKMQKQGLYRWGATWVTQQQLQQLKTMENQLKGKLDSLASQYDAATAKIASIDRDIADNQRTMSEYQSNAIAAANNPELRSRYGSDYGVSLPPAYYELEKDNKNLAAQRQSELATLDQLRQQARGVQKQYPVPLYSGAVALIGVEGTPLKLPAATTQPSPATASTQPATRAVQ